eukprot:SM000224S07112  [mRNA]  locus=s224:131391:135338:- [translate_table: standard]
MEAGFEQLSERGADWGLQHGGRYFFTRGGSSLVAFAVGGRYEAGDGFYMIGAHTDSPCPKLKPISKTYRVSRIYIGCLEFALGRNAVQASKAGFLQVGVQTYGGGLWHTWFDRDLGVAGKVLVRRQTSKGVEYISHELVKIGRPILRIPTLAIHLDRTLNETGFKVNTQTHLAPVLATSIKAELDKVTQVGAVPVIEDRQPAGESKEAAMPHHPVLLQAIAAELQCDVADICDFELQLCDVQPAALGGVLGEFVFSGRLDNLCMSFCSLKALIDSVKEPGSLEHELHVRLVALFDHEEVGSASAQGAGSPLLQDTLQRVTASFIESAPAKGREVAHALNLDPSSALYNTAVQNSFLVSADMAHCLHPNYVDKHEEAHQPKLHKGLVIKTNANQRYATNAVTSFSFREIGRLHNIPCQDFVVRNDMGCGSTIGPILASGMGVKTVDVGAPQLSMHSVREMCGVDDVAYAYLHFRAFFESYGGIDLKVTDD